MLCFGAMASRERWRAQLVSSSDAGGGALDELVSRLGLEGTGFSRLGLKLAGRQVEVALDFTDADPEALRSGKTLEGVRLSVEFERGGAAKDSDEASPTIVLRREHQLDVRDKERGLTREVQTGYERFDHAVFIDNDSTEADALQVLRSEATRQAVLRLLDTGHPSVRITRTGVSVRHRVVDEKVRVGPLLDALEDLLIVARAGGPRDPAPPRRGETWVLVGAGVCAACVAYAYLTWQAWPTSLWILSLGALAGAIVAFLARPSLEEACAGDSSSARRATLLLSMAWLASGALVFGALEHLNGSLDGSEGEVWHGVLTSTGSNRSRSRVGVRWEDGSTSSIRGDSSMHQGDRITERRHPGALGFSWVDGRQFLGR